VFFPIDIFWFLCFLFLSAACFCACDMLVSLVSRSAATFFRTRSGSSQFASFAFFRL
jgi:hypothetical protein